MSDQVVLTEFRSEVEASLAVASLEANGIRAEVRPTGPGMGFHTSLSGRTAVLVRHADVPRARQVLGAPS